MTISLLTGNAAIGSICPFSLPHASLVRLIQLDERSCQVTGVLYSLHVVEQVLHASSEVLVANPCPLRNSKV